MDNQGNRTPDQVNDAERELQEKILRLRAELLEEHLAKKRREHSQSNEKKKPSGWESFWKWWQDSGQSFVTIVTILSVLIGGLWTFWRYTEQQQQELERQQLETQIRRQSTIAQFIADLSDETKRNTAAHALAIMSQEDDILARNYVAPFLVSRFGEAVQSEGDESFTQALVLALISMGEPALEPVLTLNRQNTTNRKYDYKYLDENEDKITATTQQIMIHFLRNETAELIERQTDFSGVQLKDAELAGIRFDDLNLGSIEIIDSNLCGTSFSGTNLNGALFRNVKFSGSGTSFFEAKLDDARFESSNIPEANLVQVSAEKTTFFNGNLVGLSSKGAMFSGSNFMGSDLQRSNFENADLSGVNFSSVSLFKANLAESNLERARFIGADLENTDFTGTNLKDVEFYRDPDKDSPYVYQLKWLQEPPKSDGALVRGANFSGAQNVNDPTRVYLCKWGALNVPDGCEDVSPENFSYQFERTSGTRRSGCGRGAGI